MIEFYEPYCLADPVFFETSARRDDQGSLFPAARRPAPPGWQRAERGSWIVARPPSAVSAPQQGWKVHVSASAEQAEEVIELVWRYCVPRRLPFKFLRSQAALLTANSKYASRGSSGKLLALYPPTDSALKATLDGLGAALRGYRGPYILSDLRWGAGPLHVRYGGFTERFCDGPDGEPVLAIAGPGGRLVPDERPPVFRPPSWVAMPDFLTRQLAAREAEQAAAGSLPYQIERALHFSNAGGVYLARDPATGDQVVLKEARPLAGLDRTGRDAVARLRNEWDVLRSLGDVPFAPRALRYLTCWEHQFLVQEYVPGESLLTARAVRHPLGGSDPSEEKIAEYAHWALGVLGQIDAALAELHRRGITYGDLHPANVLLRPDGRVVFLDFELAGKVSDPRPPGLGAPGFTSPAVSPGVAADRFALGCVRLSMFVPLTPLLQWDKDKLEAFLGFATRRFRLPRGFARQVRRDITPGLRRPAVDPARATRPFPGGIAAPRTGGPDLDRPRQLWAEPGWPRLRAAIAEGILASATPERDDRLFPGDPQQFMLGGHTLAYGAAGVLAALAAAGFPGQDRHCDWLVRACQRRVAQRPGLLTGLHGAAYALDRLGRRDEAVRMLCRATELRQPTSYTLTGGQAGIGLSLLHFARATGDPAWLRLAEKCAAQILDGQDAAPAGSGPCGLTRGWSGPALFLTRLHEATGDAAALDGAQAALERDLARCQDMPDGAAYVYDGVRALPFLADGSAGVGLALAAVRAHRDDQRYARIAHGIDLACRAEMVIEPGLFHGYAGLLAYRCYRGDKDAAPSAARLAWHAISHRGHPVFPGRLLMRVSADLATGAAGVLLTLYGLASGEEPELPVPGLRPACPATTTEGRG